MEVTQEGTFAIINGILAGIEGEPASIKIPNGVTAIAPRAFKEHSELVNVSLPDSVAYIGAESFYGSNLLSVKIPGKTAYIGDEAFSECDGLVSMELPQAAPPSSLS